MGQSLVIENFKSIKKLRIDCAKINVFIGEPNTGKSNILEALGFVSQFFYQRFDPVASFVRHERTLDLFYDQLVEETVKVECEPYSATMKFEGANARGVLRSSAESWEATIGGNYNTLTSHGMPSEPTDFPVKYYKFQKRTDFPEEMPSFLAPASGRNLASLILTSKKLKRFVDEVLRPFGLRLVIKPQEKRLEIIKLLEDVLISYPYSLLSDTLHRIIFHMAAIMSNHDSILVFEEPESHAFPYYTKFLAERIALDRGSNQYFISTHNPYFLLTIAEKAPRDDLGIFVTYFEDYQTKVKPLGDKEKELLLGMDVDVFFKLEELVGRT